MLSGIGQLSTYSGGAVGSNTSAPRSSDQTAALDGEIRRDQSQLNDWVTCVSANTPKGKAEIESLSGQISAARQHIAQMKAQQPSTGAAPTKEADSRAANVRTVASNHLVATNSPQAEEGSRRGVLVNTWA